MAIANWLAQIRKAIYGKDVREAIASGIEECYNTTDSAAQEMRSSVQAVADDVYSYVTLVNNTGAKVSALQQTVDRLNDGGLVIKDDVINDQIDSWLNEHPEATTTVADGSVTNSKIDKSVFNPGSSTISPIYLGDYMCPIDYLPSSMIKIGNYIYSLDGPTDIYGAASASNEGRLMCFDIRNNVLDETKSKMIPLSHANSIAYDTNQNRIFVVPLYDFTSGTRVLVSKLYSFDTTFGDFQEIVTPVRFNSVSFDPVTKTLYALASDYIKLYKYENGEWTLYTSLDKSNVPLSLTDADKYYNQDIAIYDGKLYLSSPYRQIIYGKLTPDTTYITGSFVYTSTDSYERYRLGEIEGFEFTADGHLLGVDYTTLTTRIRNGFIVEIPVGEAIPYLPGMIGSAVFSVRDGTLTFTNATQKRFSLAPNWIRSLAQLSCRILTDHSQLVNIPADEAITDITYGPIRLVHSIVLQINAGASYTCHSLEVNNGTLRFYVGANTTIKFLCSDEEYPILITRDGRLDLGGTKAVNFSTPNRSNGNNFVYIHADSSPRFLTANYTPTSAESYVLKTNKGSKLVGNMDSAVMGAFNSMDFESGIIMKSTNDLTKYFGFIPLPYDLVGQLVSVSNASQYGLWYSDGASHTLSLDDISIYSISRNGIWVIVPATNVTNNSIMWIRLKVTITIG